jgi:hypothetical protein
MSLVFGRVGGGIVRRWSQEAKERPGWQKMTESSHGRKAVPPTNPLHSPSEQSEDVTMQRIKEKKT